MYKQYKYTVERSKINIEKEMLKNREGLNTR